MNEISFHKYQGTGNDFVIIDDRSENFDPKNTELIAHLCHRKFGIGADGLMLLRNHPVLDFEMIYFNSDGNESTMCGNGGRCLVKFAHSLGVFSEKCTFMAIDGEHEAFLQEGLIHLKMMNVGPIDKQGNDFVLDTGSPHYIQFVGDAQSVEVVEEARKIRYNDTFQAEGINVNFVEQRATDQLKIRTYERGVEDETLSCGTGVTAAALSLATSNAKTKSPVAVEVEGGKLLVEFEKADGGFQNIYLIGPAEHVFSGVYSITS